LPIPGIPWASISLDFIEALPNSNGKEVTLVIVDRLTKYSHFLALSHPYSVEMIVQIILDTVVRLHGPPQEISNRDRTFTCNLYQQIFQSLNVKLKFSTAYHRQTDGQTEWVNQCLEAYWRSMVFQDPKQWSKWLPMAEWWYNTSYHSSMQMAPFEALYHYPPPMIREFNIATESCPAATSILAERDRLMQQLKANLQAAQNRMKFHADKNRTDRQLEQGAMVYLKISAVQAKCFRTPRISGASIQFYGPFKVLERVGDVAYKLHLPGTASIHPVIHISQLKEHVGKNAIPLPHVPLVTQDGKIKTEPFAVNDEQIIQRKKTAVKQ
jgi:hypothetical protein